MLNFLISLVLGMFPEVLFITMMTSYLENKNNKRIVLFILNSIGYIILIMLCRFELLFYVLYVVYLYLILKMLYKVNISSFFMISLIFSFIILISFLCSLLPSYIIGYIISRIILLIAYVVCRKPLYKLYQSYKNNWNRGNNHKIKSITLRNCSLVFVNVMIVALDIFLIMCSIYLMNL